MNDEDKKQAAIQAALDKRADAIRDEVDAKAEAARAADAKAEISEKAPARLSSYAAQGKTFERVQTQIDKPEPEPRRELPRASLSDHRAPSYSGQGIAHNIDMQRATNPAAYIQEKREALEKKAPDLKRAAENLKQPAPRPETEAGKAWQAEKLRNPETATAWHLGAAAVKNDLENSPNALVREEHKMRLEADPVYKNGYENAQRWEAERKAELVDEAPDLESAAEVSKESAAEATPLFNDFNKEAKDLDGAGFAKAEHEASKIGAKLPEAAIEQHKERMVNEPDYRDAYGKAAAPLHAERQAEAAAAREQKQAEAAPAPQVEHAKEQDLTLVVGVS